MTPRLVGKDCSRPPLALNQVLWQRRGHRRSGGRRHRDRPRRAVRGRTRSTSSRTARMFFAALMLRPMPPRGRARPDSGMAAVREGFGYVRRNRLLQSTFVIDLIAMIFGHASGALHVPRGLAVPPRPRDRGAAVRGSRRRRAVGALTSRMGPRRPAARMGGGPGGDGVGRRDRRVRTRRANIWLALLCWRSPAAADVISAIFRNDDPAALRAGPAARQDVGHLHPRRDRRPRLGDFEAGLVATVFTPTISVVSGGLACIVGAGVVALAYPELRRYRADRVPLT